MSIKTTEKGQALVLIALAAVGLFAFAALAIDGSRSYSDKRHAQNAADTAVLAGALAYTRNNTISSADIDAVILNRTTSNGYNDNGASNDVTITITDVPAGGCPGNVAGKDIKVDIVSQVDTTFARVIGRNQVTNAVTATSRACGFYIAPLFDGEAIVGLNPGPDCAFDTGNTSSAKWKIKGSGLFSNSCAFSKDEDSVVFVDGDCASAVNGSNHDACPQPGQALPYPDIVFEVMPPDPCDFSTGDVGIHTLPPIVGDDVTFTNGVYCIPQLDDYDQKNIILNNATLYVTDTDFNLQFAGKGGFLGTPSSSGDYKNYYMVVAYEADTCDSFTENDAQRIVVRGNGTNVFSGTILAPSACIDLRGNGTGEAIHSQIIGYNVTSNGTADVFVDYQVDEQHKNPVQPTISVLK